MTGETHLSQSYNFVRTEERENVLDYFYRQRVHDSVRVTFQFRVTLDFISTTDSLI